MRKKQHTPPPSLLNGLLKAIYGKDRFDEVYGDLHELYSRRYEKNGHIHAMLFFIIDTFLSMRNMRLGTTYRRQPLSLFYHNWLMAIRVIKRNSVYASLSILGLSVGIASYIVIYTHISFEESYDQFHTKSARIYRVDYKLYHQNELLSHTATTPPTIAPFIKDRIPGIKDFVRIFKYPGLVIRHKESVFKENEVLMVDSNFFNVFDFQTREGNKLTALKERGAMMISRKAKYKYFGEESALGKTISIDGYEDYYITGVFDDPPKNSHLQFDFLISFETARWWFEGETETDWTSADYYSYILLDEKTNLTSTASLLSTINSNTPQGRIDLKNNVVRTYGLTALEKIHLHSFIEEEIDHTNKGSILSIQFLSIMAYFILFISWFNCINQSTARSFTRSKEIGLRKVIGASRPNLIFQFFTESFMVHFVSLLIGLGLVFLAQKFLPQMFGLNTDLSGLLKSGIIIKVLVFIATGFVISSFLPSYFLSKAHPLKALKGSLKSGLKGQVIRRLLVTIQLSVSAILITSTIVIFLQKEYINSQPLGFQTEKMLVVDGPTTGEVKVSIFSNELERHANIHKVVSTEFMPGRGDIETVPIARKDQPNIVYDGINTFSTGYQYLSTLGIKFLAGRDFLPQFKTDTATIIINQSALEKMGFEKPQQALNTVMRFGSGNEVKVIGVIEDYLQTSAKSVSLPLAIWLYPEENNHFVIKYRGDAKAVHSELKQVFNTLYPEDPLEYYSLEGFYRKQFDADEQFSRAFFVFTIIAILISCLGLLSVVYWSTAAKKKEIGIRKVLGAKVRQIIYFISREFKWMIISSYLVAVPITYFLLNSWLNNYASRITLNIPIYLTSLIIMLLIIALTAGYKTYRSAIVNPVEVLNEE